MIESMRAKRLENLISSNASIMVGMSLIGILAVMVLLLPPGFLDVLLAFNITFALIILMVTFYVKDPLGFSVFPTLLLFLTLFRLALNVASTRLILLDGYAGKVIDSFGSFVVGGNPVVGMIVFIILVVIQFIVITKGAGRVAEVAARFTLDAMPGKQMAIDADLNAGLIDEREAKNRRERIGREADFFGAMDGASKFVRGDAIAGIIITVVNILGGFIIGVAQQGMPFSQALGTYTLLTVGDGLVSQIPALIISIGAGVVVTRGRSEHDLGDDFIRQIFSQSRALGIAGAALLLLGFVPGMPNLPFLLLGVGSSVAAFRSRKREKMAAEEVEESTAPAEEQGDPLEDPAIFQVDRLECEIGYGLISLADVGRKGNLLERVTGVRRQLARELGIFVSPIRIRDNIQLGPNEYALKLKGVELERGELLPGHLLCIASADERGDLKGIETLEPAFNLPALWIQETAREKAGALGLTVVEPTAVLATHMSEIIRRHADEIMTRQDVQRLVAGVHEVAPALVDELIPGQVKLGFLQKVLANLLHERVSIRDMVSILEAVGDWAPQSQSSDFIAEKVRESLGRIIVKDYCDETGLLAVITVDPAIEQLFMDALGQYGETGGVSLPPDAADRFHAGLRTEVERTAQKGMQPVLLVSSPIRLVFKRFTETMLPGLAVLAYSEVPLGQEVKATGMVKLHD